MPARRIQRVFRRSLHSEGGNQPEREFERSGGQLTMLLRETTVMLCLLVPLGAGAEESIDIESTFVGDKEQPSVSYFIPWRPPEGPDKLYRPIK